MGKKDIFSCLSVSILLTSESPWSHASSLSSTIQREKGSVLGTEEEDSDLVLQFQCKSPALDIMSPALTCLPPFPILSLSHSTLPADSALLAFSNCVFSEAVVHDDHQAQPTTGMLMGSSVSYLLCRMTTMMAKLRRICKAQKSSDLRVSRNSLALNYMSRGSCLLPERKPSMAAGFWHSAGCWHSD